MVVSLWWAYFPFVQSTCSIKCSAAMPSLQQNRWQFAHHQLYPQQQSTDPDQVIFLPTKKMHLSTFKSHSPWPASQLCSSALSMKGGDEQHEHIWRPVYYAFLDRHPSFLYFHSFFSHCLLFLFSPQRCLVLAGDTSVEVGCHWAY